MNHTSEISDIFKGVLYFLVYVRMLSLEVMYFCSFVIRCVLAWTQTRTKKWERKCIFLSLFGFKAAVHILRVYVNRLLCTILELRCIILEENTAV